MLRDENNIIMQVKKELRRKIVVDGLKYKVDYKVYKIMEQLQNQLANHTLALYNYIEIFNSTEEPSEMETILYKYCMQLPHAETIEEEIKNPKEKVIEKAQVDK